MNLKQLESFKLSDAIKFHDKLNPELWINNKLRLDVKKQLKIIAEDFLEELGISGLDVKDLTISGSNAAYTYTPHSDLDLHILIDMNELSNNDVYKELFNAKKTVYNDSHDIKIHGIPVELYVQDTNQPVVSVGEYSLLQDKWTKIPTKRRANFDQNATKAKYEKLHSIVDYALKSKNLSVVKKVINKIKQYRQAGLDKGGEFSPENLAYKALRSQEYITKLYALRDRLHSEKLSIESMYAVEDYSANDTPPGPEFKPTMPRGTVKVDVSDVYDWYKLGQHISNLKGLGKHDFGKGPPSTILSFGDEDTEHKYIQDLLKTGLTTTDIDPAYHDKVTGQKTDPRYNVDESLDDSNYAIHLGNLPKFHSGKRDSLIDFVPERETHLFALHSNPLHMKKTIAGLTGKDWFEFAYSPRLLAGYRPSLVKITPDTLVADMHLADRYYSNIGNPTPEDKKQAGLAYAASVKPLSQADLNQYKKPELLIPKNNLQFSKASPKEISNMLKNWGETTINEGFDQPYKLKWEKSMHGDYDAWTNLPDGSPLSIMFNNEYKKNWMVEFYRSNSQSVTGEGDAQRIFATVLHAIKQFIKKKKPTSLLFHAVKEDDLTGSRAKLYDRLVQRYASNLGYTVQRQELSGAMAYKLIRVENLKENQNIKAEEYKAKLLQTLPVMMNFLNKVAKDPKPTEQDMLDAIEAGYQYLLDNPDATVKDAGAVLRQHLSSRGLAESQKVNNLIANKIFFARSNIAPKGWSYDHVGFITQDRKQIQMSGHKGNEVYVTNAVTDDPEFPKQKIKIVSLPKPVSVPTTNSVGAENCGTFVANVLKSNGIKGIDTQKLYSVMKKPRAQGVAEGASDPTHEDLKDVAHWMNTTPDNLSIELKQEPIQKFIKQIKEMYGTYDEFPEDEERTNRILKLLKRGAKPLPMYVEKGDPDLFVMEGRHRMVAFWLADMKTIPVAYVSKKIEESATVTKKFSIKKGKNSFGIELSVEGKLAGIYQYNSLTNRHIAEVYPEFKGKGYGKLLVLKALETAGKLGMDFIEDESRTSEYDNVIDSLENSGLIVRDEEYLYLTQDGLNYLKTNLSESASGYIPSNAQKNDPRYKTALTVDVKPDTMKKDTKKFGNKITRAGIPPIISPNGKF